MSNSQVRSYINSRMPTVEPDLKEHLDSFNIENIPRTLINKRYHIAIGPSTSSNKIDLHIDELVPVTMTIWSQGFRNVVTATDALLDRAHCIRMDLINPVNIATFGRDLIDFNSFSIVPSEIAVSNDDTVQVQMEFVARFAFGTP